METKKILSSYLFIIIVVIIFIRIMIIEHFIINIKELLFKFTLGSEMAMMEVTMATATFI